MQRPQDDRLLSILDDADIAPIARGRQIAFVAALPTAFVADAPSRVSLGPAALDGPLPARVVLRQALEVCVQLEIAPSDPVLAGLMAARVAALFWRLEGSPPPRDDRHAWLPTFANDTPLAPHDVDAAWRELAVHQPEAPKAVSAAAVARLGELWPHLGPAEVLMGLGGDARIKLDPRTGLNAYGCSARPRPWAVTFASSTASSISERGYAAAEGSRQHFLRAAIHDGLEAAQRQTAAAIRSSLAHHYCLDRGCRIILTPSGTDGELCALAIALLADPSRPLSSLLVAPEETGTGVPLAAVGRHFLASTARGEAVQKGELIDGFPGDIALVCVPLRTASGACRPSAETDAESAAHVAAAVAKGHRVLLHVIDQSKTGVVAPTNAHPIRERHPGQVDVVVDASQARLSIESVQRHLSHGFMVLLTGSKFFTGPPFAGALLLPADIASRLERSEGLPAGLTAYFGRYDWPEEASVASALPRDSNLGLAIRWAASLAEMEAFFDVEPPVVKDILSRFAARVCAAMRANSDLYLHDVPALPPRETADAWDTMPTIFTFSVWARMLDVTGPRQLLSEADARRVHAWLNSDLSACLPSTASNAERLLAARRFHIGQPVALATSHGATGAMRLCIGARLVSGEPSQAHLPFEARLDGEIADALAVLDKISLVMDHFSRIHSANPIPSHR